MFMNEGKDFSRNSLGNNLTMGFSFAKRQTMLLESDAFTLHPLVMALM